MTEPVSCIDGKQRPMTFMDYDVMSIMIRNIFQAALTQSFDTQCKAARIQILPRVPLLEGSQLNVDAVVRAITRLQHPPGADSLDENEVSKSPNTCAFTNVAAVQGENTSLPAFDLPLNVHHQVVDRLYQQTCGQSSHDRVHALQSQLRVSLSDEYSNSTSCQVHPAFCSRLTRHRSLQSVLSIFFLLSSYHLTDAFPRLPENPHQCYHSCESSNQASKSSLILTYSNRSSPNVILFL